MRRTFVALVAGVGLTAASSARAADAAKVEVGGVRLSGGALGFTASETDVAVQPGAGVDVTVTPNMAVRVQGDYRLIRSSGASDNNFRLMLGIVLHQ